MLQSAVRAIWFTFCLSIVAIALPTALLYDVMRISVEHVTQWREAASQRAAIILTFSVLAIVFICIDSKLGLVSSKVLWSTSIPTLPLYSTTVVFEFQLIPLVLSLAKLIGLTVLNMFLVLFYISLHHPFLLYLAILASIMLQT